MTRTCPDITGGGAIDFAACPRPTRRMNPPAGNAPPTLIALLGNATEIAALTPLLRRLSAYARIVVVYQSRLESLAHGSALTEMETVTVVEPDDAIAPALVRWLQDRRRRASGLVARALWVVERVVMRVMRGNPFVSMRRWSVDFIVRESPITVLAGSDRDHRRGLALLAVARAARVPVVVMPVAYPAFEASLADLRDTPAHRLEPGDALGARHPAHVIALPGGRIASYFPRRAYRELEAAGLVTGDPRVLGGSFATLVLSATPQLGARLVEAGLSPGQVQIVGSVEHDAVARSLTERDAVRARLGVSVDATVIGWAVHQYFEHAMLTKDASDAMMRGVADVLRVAIQLDHPAADAASSPVLASLHPKMPAERYGWIARDHPPIRVVPDRLDTWLGACDLFVCAGGSSTAEWSAAIGVPTIVYDFIGLDASLYAAQPAIRVVRDVAGLETLVASFRTRDAAWFEWRAASLAGRDAFGPMDGRAFERIAQALGLSVPIL